MLEQIAVLASLVEGNSIRATCRMTGVAKGTVLSLLESVGAGCADHQRRAFRNLDCKRVQVDEIWAFCHAKSKNVPEKLRGRFGFGDVWTFTSICADSKLVPVWQVGNRDYQTAWSFMRDLASRMRDRIQITSDGSNVYEFSVVEAFAGKVDYAMLQKIYGRSAVALHFMYYNYCRVHQTLGVTPAMAAGVTDRVWTLENVLQLVESN